MFNDFISIVPLPEHIRVYAEYKELSGEHKGESRYSRVHFVGITDIGDPAGKFPVFLDFDANGVFGQPDEMDNFVQYHINETWLTDMPKENP